MQTYIINIIVKIFKFKDNIKIEALITRFLKFHLVKNILFLILDKISYIIEFIFSSRNYKKNIKCNPFILVCEEYPQI